MIEHYSHIRIEAKRAALDAIAPQPLQAVIEGSVNQNVNQPSASDSKASVKSLNVRSDHPYTKRSGDMVYTSWLD
jgi:hypothetical protein